MQWPSGGAATRPTDSTSEDRLSPGLKARIPRPGTHHLFRATPLKRSAHDDATSSHFIWSCLVAARRYFRTSRRVPGKLEYGSARASRATAPLYGEAGKSGAQGSQDRTGRRAVGLDGHSPCNEGAEGWVAIGRRIAGFGQAAEDEEAAEIRSPDSGWRGRRGG